MGVLRCMGPVYVGSIYASLIKKITSLPTIFLGENKNGHFRPFWELFWVCWEYSGVYWEFFRVNWEYFRVYCEYLGVY